MKKIGEGVGRKMGRGETRGGDQIQPSVGGNNSLRQPCMLRRPP